MPTNIVDVPPEILLDNLFPVLPVTDLLSLTVTSKVVNISTHEKMKL